MSSEERCQVHQRVERLLDRGGPDLVYTVLINLIAYERCMLRGELPIDLLQEEALSREHAKFKGRYEKYEKCKAGARLHLVRRKGGKVDHGTH